MIHKGNPVVNLIAAVGASVDGTWYKYVLPDNAEFIDVIVADDGGGCAFFFAFGVKPSTELITSLATARAEASIHGFYTDGGVGQSERITLDVRDYLANPHNSRELFFQKRGARVFAAVFFNGVRPG